MRRALTTAFLLFVLLLPWRAGAADDPALSYYTITTPHFLVHYHEGAEALAWKVAKTCEEAHQIFSPLLDWVPAQRTHVYVNDKSDVANGSATVYGRPHINIFGMAPEASSVLGFFDDWIRILVYHEYVHILHLDTIRGIPPYVNALIGKQWAPNQTLPRWYVEGLATYHESRRTRGGRVDGSLFQMHLRTAALENTFFDLGAASGLPVEWPGGTVAYLYGGFFLDHVFSKHGEDFGTKFNHIYGGRVMPWGLNRVARDLTGETFDEMWQEWSSIIAAQAQATRIAVRAAGETPLEPITHEGGQTGEPEPRPGTSEVSFFYYNHEREPAYAVTRVGNREVETLVNVESGAGSAAWTPDGQTLLFSQPRTYQNVYRYQDLYAWNAQSGSLTQITRKERARDPALSPDGKKLVYVRNKGGTMDLVLRDWEHPSREPVVLVTGESYAPESDARWHQISTPAFSPDSRRVAFSMWRLDNESRDLWMYDFEAAQGERLVRLTADFAVDLDPHFGPDGLLYFSSDRTGIYNVHAMDVDTGEIWQVSNVLTGVFAPAVSPDGQWIYVSAYTADGFDLARFPRPTRFWKSAAESRKEIPPLVYPEIDVSEFHVAPYRPSRYLAPLLLQPNFGVLTSGAGLGLSLLGFDPVGHHQYRLEGGFTTGPDLTDYGANIAARYEYGRLPTHLSLSGGVRDYPRTRSLFAQSDWIPFTEREYVGRLRLSYPFRGLTDTLTFATRFDVEFTEFSEDPRLDHEPGDLEPSFPEQGWFNELTFAVGYTADKEAYPQSVSTTKGWGVGLSFSLQDPLIGSDYRTLTFGYDADAYLQNPWLDRHVLALRMAGALRTTDRRNPAVYSIGGNSPQDVFTSVVFQQARNNFVVRGYPPRVLTGQNFQIAGAEYRFPLLHLDEGFGTAPIFLRQIKGSVFFDTGTAYDGFLNDATHLAGAGAELQLQTLFAYYLFGNLRLGYARGLIGEDAIHDFYVLFGGGF